MKPRSLCLFLILLTVGLLTRFGTTPSIAIAQGTPAATAQLPTCPPFVKAALEATNTGCADTGRNQACYGSVSIKAEPQTGVTNFTFEQVGNTVDLATIQSLQLSALKPDDKTWGIVLVRMQANLPGTVTGQTVTMLLFGDVQMQNAVARPSLTLDTTTTAATAVYLRPFGSIIGRLAINDPVTLTGHLKDNTWLRIQMVDKEGKPSGIGWLPVKMVKATGQEDKLDVIDPAAPVYGPMQAFYFRTGIGPQACQEAPRNGVLIQTPKGGRRVTLLINDVKVTVGSTLLLTAQPGGTARFATLDGLAVVEARGRIQTVNAGRQVEVPMDAQLRASGPPGTPQPYKLEDIQNLPLPNLPDKVTAAPPGGQAGRTIPPTSGAGSSAPGGTNQTAVFCPAGSAQFLDYDIPGVGRQTVTAPCQCANGFTTESYEGNYNGQSAHVTARICN